MSSDKYGSDYVVSRYSLDTARYCDCITSYWSEMWGFVVIIISRLQWHSLCYISTTLDYCFICDRDLWWEKSSKHWYSHVLYFFTKQIRFWCNHCQTRRNTLWRDVRGGCPAWRWWFLQQSGFAESLMCISWCWDVTHHVCLQANTALLLAHMLWGVRLCLFQLVGKRGAQSWERRFSPS